MGTELTRFTRAKLKALADTPEGRQVLRKRIACYCGFTHLQPGETGELIGYKEAKGVEHNWRLVPNYPESHDAMFNLVIGLPDDLKDGFVVHLADLVCKTADVQGCLVYAAVELKAVAFIMLMQEVNG